MSLDFFSLTWYSPVKKMGGRKEAEEE